MSQFPVVFKTDFTEVQPPCATCRHSEICTEPERCHAARFHASTGKAITPPRVYPGLKVEQEIVQPPTKDKSSHRGISELEREFAAFRKDMAKGGRDNENS